jgi:putative membrane protein
MPMPQIKPGLAGIFLGLVSTALLVNSPIVHPQENAGQPSATQSEGGGASGASSTTTTITTESAGASEIRLSQSDERMLKQLAQAHLSEINLGKLAQDKAQSDEVKSFAKKMVNDYTKAQDELRQLAQSKSIALPTEPDRQQQSVEKKLAALSGEKFDRQYMQHEGTRAHRETYRLLERITSKAEDAELKSYAGKIIGTVESHQQMATDTRKNLKSTSEGKSGTGTGGEGRSESPAGSGGSGSSGSSGGASDAAPGSSGTSQ